MSTPSLFCRYEIADGASLELRLPLNGITSIFGPVGAGKTNLLNVVSGIKRMKGATVSINGKVYQKGKIYVPPHQRDIGYVFQKNSLFEFKTIRQNLLYGASRRKESKQHVSFDELCQALDLIPHLDKYPHQISTGQQQLASFAQALLSGPSLLLLDEPTSSLDTKTRQTLLRKILEVHDTTKIPILMVTHHLDEVYGLSDHVIWFDQSGRLNNGRIDELMQSTYLPQQNEHYAIASLPVKNRTHTKDEFTTVFHFEKGDCTVPSVETNNAHRFLVYPDALTICEKEQCVAPLTNIATIEAIYPVGSFGLEEHLRMLQLSNAGNLLFAKMPRYELYEKQYKPNDQVYFNIRYLKTFPSR